MVCVVVFRNVAPGAGWRMPVGAVAICVLLPRNGPHTQAGVDNLLQLPSGLLPLHMKPEETCLPSGQDVAMSSCLKFDSARESFVKGRHQDQQVSFVLKWPAFFGYKPRLWVAASNTLPMINPTNGTPNI